MLNISKTLKIFDSNIMLGKYARFNENSFYDISSFLKYLDYYGINRALLYSSLSKEYDPEYGNNFLIQETGGLEKSTPDTLLGY